MPLETAQKRAIFGVSTNMLLLSTGNLPSIQGPHLLDNFG